MIVTLIDARRQLNHEEMALAKAPEIIRRRFRISAETETERVGELLATLTLMGFERISYDLIDDVATYRRNGKRTEPESPGDQPKEKTKAGKDVIIEFIEAHPSFKMDELVQFFVAQNLSPNHSYKLVKDLVKAGVLRKVGRAQYQRTDIKALAPPPRSKRARIVVANPSQRKNTHSAKNFVRRYDTSNRDLILRCVGKRKTITISELRAFLTENERPQKSASPMLFKMVGDGLFGRTKVAGEYTVTEKGQAEARRVGDRLRRLEQKAAEGGITEEKGPENEHG